MVTLLCSVAVFVHLERQFQWRRWFADHGRIAWVEALARRDHSTGGDVFREAWERRDMSPAYYTHLLDLQADPAATWDFTRAYKLAIAAQNGQLTDPQQLARYERQAFAGVAFAVRSPVRLGDPLFVRATARRGTASPLFQQMTLAVGTDGPVGPPTDRAVTTFHNADVDYDFTVPPENWQPANLAPGKHRLTLSSIVRLSRFDASHQFLPIGPDVPVTGSSDVTVVPSTATSATAVPDPGMADAVARAVNLHLYDPQILTVDIHLLPVNVDRAFTVYAVVDGQRRQIGQVAALRGQTARCQQLVRWTLESPVSAERVTVVFVADPAALNGTLSQRTYWPGEIAYRDVPIQPASDLLRDRRLMQTPTTLPYRVEPGRDPPMMRLP